MQVSFDDSSAQSAHWMNGARPFLVGVDDKSGDARIVVHALRTDMSRDQARQLKRQLREEGVFRRFRVKRYRGVGPRSLRTLEAFLAPFTHDHILYDATGAFQRAQKLLRVADAARESLGGRIASLFWQSSASMLYVVLDTHHFPKQYKARRAEMARTEVVLRKILDTHCGKWSSDSDFVKGVTMSFSLPRVSATPIDEKSVIRDQAAH